MSFKRIEDYRNEAEGCLSRAQITSSTATKLLWLTLAEDWLLLGDRVEMNETKHATKLVGDGDAQRALRQASSGPQPWI